MGLVDEPMNKNSLLTRYPIDLHAHTTRSDGQDTPIELIEKASGLGMHAIAITDHDIPPPSQWSLPSGEAVNLSSYAETRGILYVPGYEFSTDTWVDDVHICGYGLNWSHPDLQAEVAAEKASKSEEYQLLCERLTELGKPIDWDMDVLHYHLSSGEPAIRKPEEVQRKHIFEVMAAKGFADSWSAAKLFVRNSTELNIRRQKIDPCEAIALIHRCGGVAVLAHPYLIDAVIYRPAAPPIDRFEYIDQLIAAKLDGIEIRYTYDKTTYQGSLTPEQIEAETCKRYRFRLPILSGGSDYHGDQKFGEQKQRSLGERGLNYLDFIEIKDRLVH
jgi:3',5'-nucleoside bisphosphate phosphatase